MYAQEKSRKPRNSAFLLDMMHIVIGAVIVVMAVLSFLNPEDHMLLFPIIFLLAAILNLVNGISRIRQNIRERKHNAGGLLVLLFGILLLAFSVISAVSIWWG